jgi:hypothetical protein
LSHFICIETQTIDINDGHCSKTDFRFRTTKFLSFNSKFKVYIGTISSSSTGSNSSGAHVPSPAGTGRSSRFTPKSAISCPINGAAGEFEETENVGPETVIEAVTPRWLRVRPALVQIRDVGSGHGRPPIGSRQLCMQFKGTESREDQRVADIEDKSCRWCAWIRFMPLAKRAQAVGETANNVSDLPPVFLSIGVIIEKMVFTFLRMRFC